MSGCIIAADVAAIMQLHTCLADNRLVVLSGTLAVLTLRVKPYMAAINDVSGEHREAFQQCVQLAQRDATTDKDILHGMKRKLYAALKKIGGSLSQHDKQVSEIMDVIRLHEDRQHGFNRVAAPFIQQIEQSKNRGLSL